MTFRPPTQVANNVATITTSLDHELETAGDHADLATAHLPVTIGGATNCSYLNGRSFPFQPVDYWNPSRRQITLTNFSGANCSDTGGTLTVPETRPAPIQGLRLRDGSWTATGLNKLHSVNGYGWFHNRILNANSITTTVVEGGPLKIVLRLSYAFDRPAYTNPKVIQPRSRHRVLCPATS